MNTINASTGFSPFQLKTGRSPCLIPPLILILADATPAEISARDIIDHLQTDVKEAQNNLLTEKVRQAYHANEHRGPEEVYAMGDLVMLSTTNRRRHYKRNGKKRVAKFMPRHNGRTILRRSLATMLAFSKDSFPTTPTSSRIADSADHRPFSQKMERRNM